MIQRNAAPIVAVVVLTLSVGGLSIAQGSSHPSDSAKAAKAKKKRHVLDADYKTNEITVISEGEGSSDVQLSDEPRLAGRPFGSIKPELRENRFFTFNIPDQMPRMDYSGSEQVSFTASVFAPGASTGGKFRGFWNYLLDSEGNILSPITGVITGGTGKFRGAGGRFDVLDLHRTSTDPERQAGHWKGFIRY